MAQNESEGQVTHSMKFCERFEWTIEEFFSRDLGTYVESPGFHFDYAIWHLAIGTKENSQSPSVFLKLWRTQKSFGSRYAVKVGVKNKNDRDCEIVSYDTDVEGFLEVRKFLPWTTEKNERMYPGGRITIFCEICPPRKGKEKPKLADSSTCLLKENLKNLFLSEDNSDVKLKVEDKIFQAHRAILIARCPVFSSMFQYDMEEKNSGVVDIPDCSADAFKVFLYYLYTGDVDKCISECVCNVYYIADKYDVQELKEHCSRLLQIKLSVENFCDIVALSLRHSESKLLEAACSFFAQNVKVIIKTVQWQKYLKENPIHANELYIKAIDA